MIVLSQILDWLNVSVSSEVVTPTDVEVEQRADGVSALPYDDAPEDYVVETETFEVQGLLTWTSRTATSNRREHGRTRDRSVRQTAASAPSGTPAVASPTQP